jgi:uncharacterized lipoprotein YbaY
LQVHRQSGTRDPSDLPGEGYRLCAIHTGDRDVSRAHGPAAAAVFEAALEDVSRADAPAETIARTRVASPGNPPIAFTIAYDPARILADHRYVVRARILLDDKLLFTTDTATPVITRSSR